MTNSIKYLLFIAFISFSDAEEKPIKINITGNVLDKNVTGLKGAKLVIENNNGEKLENEKSGKEGKFKFRATIDSFEDASEYETAIRNIKTNFSVTIHGYLLPETFSNVTTTQKYFSKKKIMLNETAE